MSRLRLLGCMGVFALMFFAAACGEGHEPLKLVEWPYLERPQSLKINGAEFKAYLANSESHRRRARLGLALHENEAIAYLYPETKDPIEFEFGGVTEPVELVFVDSGSKVLRIEKVAPFLQRTFPEKYAVKDARVVLQLPEGSSEKLKLSAGAAVTTEPDLVKSSEQASGEFTDLYFIVDQRPEDKPEATPSVRVKVLEKAEDAAQGMKDRPHFKEGEGVIIAYGGTGSYAEFWLKETEGPLCACFIERTTGGRQGTMVIGAYYENLKPEGSRDIERPIFCAPEMASHLVIFKGTDFFTKNKIMDRARVVLSGDQRYDNEKPDFQNLPLKFGDRKLSAKVATHEAEKRAGLLAAPSLKKHEAIVFNFDDAAFVEFDPAGMQGEARLMFVGGDGTGKYTLTERKLNAQSAPIKAGEIKDGRFVIAVPKDFDVAGFEMPYVLRDLKPSTAAVVFYDAKAAVVKDRWPATSKARVRVELAVTDAEQRRGLMYRESLRPDHGMLFVYKQEQEDGLNFWMKNCKMDLSIAFVDRKGVIVKIHQRMKAPQPGTPDYQLEQYTSGGPARFAIEMEPEWFAKNNINVGDRVFIPSQYTASE